MQAPPGPDLSLLARRPRSAIPLTSILNADNEGEPAAIVPVKVEAVPPVLEAAAIDDSAVKSSQFLFVNSHTTSRPRARQRPDQKIINAHVQHASNRQRRAAAVGRLKPNDRLCSSCASAGLSSRTAISASQSNRSANSPSNEGRSSTRNIPHTGVRQTSLPSRKYSQSICSRCGVDLSIEGGDIDLAVVKTITEMEMRRQTSHVLSGDRTSPFQLQSTQSPHSMLDATVIDPFGTGTVSLTMDMNGVMNHFLQVLIGAFYPIPSQADAQRAWTVQIVLAEPRVLFSLLAVSAADIQARTGHLGSSTQLTAYTERGPSKSRAPSFVDYKVKAINAFNDNSTMAENGADVGTICVVMSMLLLEGITGNHNEISKYVAVLQRLVTLRGGYHGLPLGVVSAALPISYMSAAMTRSFPICPPPAPLPMASSATYDMLMSGINPELRQLGTGLLEPVTSALFGRTLMQAFRDTCEVTVYREYFHSRECVLPIFEFDYFGIKGYEALFRTLSVPFEPQEAVLPQQEPCRIALLIFSHANFEIYQCDSAIFRSLSKQLKSGLEQSDLKSRWHPHQDLLIWALFLGAYISVGQREHTWFIIHLARAAQLVGLKQAPDLKSVLVRFYYIDRIYHNKLEDIWEEAETMMDAT